MQRLLLLFLIYCLVSLGAPRVREEIESRDVIVGEAFTYQIVVSDAKKIEPIELPQNDDFQVKSFPPSQNNSTQVSFVNGQVSKIERHETIYRFLMVPRRKGNIIIPSVKVIADGTELRTRAVRVNVGDGEQVTDIILELSFDETDCYVGQTLMAKWTLFFGRQLSIGDFDLPLFSDSSFSFPAYEDKIDQNQVNNYRRVPVAGVDGIIGKLGSAIHNGESMRCLTFSRPVTAMKPGAFSIAAGSVICEIPDKRARARRPANPFFDDFFDRTPMRSILIKGNTVKLNVKELPKEERPDDFTGILGKCSLAVAAKPLEVNVGDPIVMTLSVNGLAYADSVRIPKIASMPALEGKFKVSDEDSGIVRDGAKVFQCTLRALNGNVTEIPPLRIPFFNSASGKYEFAESEPVPLTVHEVATVTAADVQGTAVTQDAPVGAEIESLDSGIAHNYTYDRLLDNIRPGFTQWSLRSWKSLACAGSLLLYILVIATTAIVRHYGSDPSRSAWNHAVSDAQRTIAKATDEGTKELFNALQTVLADKLKLPPGALSFDDVEPALKKKGMDDDNLRKLKTVFADLEAANYAGGAVRQGIADDVRAICREIHRL